MAIKKKVTVQIPPINIQELELTLIGDTRLVTHNWDTKSKQMMKDKQAQIPAAGKKPPRDPESDFRASLYTIVAHKDVAKGVYGFPSIAFKAAAVTAITNIEGVTKVSARQCLRVPDGLLKIHSKAPPAMREDMVRVGMGTADIRYRAEFMNWHIVLPLRFDAGVMSASQIANILNRAGFGVGVGEWRPEKNGEWGTFHVATAAEIKRLKK